MNNHYDMKEQMKEILKMNGGKAFFDELNAAGIPFFFIAATENTEDKTEYHCETITPGAMGIRLTDDKFADHLNIQHQGFVTVLESQTTSPGMKGQKLGGETGIKTGIVSAEDKGSATEESSNVAALELLDDVIEAVIRQQASGQESQTDDRSVLNPISGEYCEELSIVRGTNPHQPANGSQDKNIRD